MWFTKQTDGFRVWFAVKKPAGNLRTGIPAGEFMATVVNPSDSASLTPAVAESATKPGLYSLFVTPAFLTAHGNGEYGVVVEVLATAPVLKDVIGDVLMVTSQDLDTLATAAQATSIQADTDDIQARLPASLVGGRMRSHVEAMDADVIGAAQIAAGAITASEAPALANLDATVSSRAVPGDAMDLIPGSVDAAALAADAVAEIADGVWDEPLAGHLAAGSTGKALDDAQDAGSPAQIAAAVWDEALPGAHAAGSAGERLATTDDRVDVVVSTRAELTRQVLIEKILRNKLITDPVAGTITIFDDDSVTPLITAALFEDVAGTQTYRGSGADRRNRMT